MVDAFTKIVFTQFYININDIFIFKISKLTDLAFYIFLGIDANSLKMINNVRIVFSFLADPKISYQLQRFRRIVDFDFKAVSLTEILLRFIPEYSCFSPSRRRRSG